MHKLRILSAAAQVAEYLRGGLLAGRWSGTMPGGDALAAELGVGVNTVEAALLQLEAEGLLINQGRRRGRLIRLPKGGITRTALRVAILLSETEDYSTPLIASLPNELEQAGHVPVNPGKTAHDLNMDVRRIARLVNQTAADAWVVTAGSREVLEWFSSQEVPAFALFGRCSDLPIAGTGPDMIAPFIEGIRRLIALGHQRIVSICRGERRFPTLGEAERAFLGELVNHGIPTGNYNLPDWQESNEGLQKVLRESFRLTPPTALILDEPAIFAAVQQFLARRSIQIPEDVSLFCTDPCPTQGWDNPSIAHLRWDSGPLLRCILRWAENVAQGKEDRRQRFTKAQFVDGGTIGPAKGNP